MPGEKTNILSRRQDSQEEKSERPKCMSAERTGNRARTHRLSFLFAAHRSYGNLIRDCFCIARPDNLCYAKSNVVSNGGNE